MKKKVYDYLICYEFNAKGFLTSCRGTMGLSRINKINTFDELNKVKECVETQLNTMYEEVTNVCIYNFILLGKNKHSWEDMYGK